VKPRNRDEITKEGYREMYHRVKEENVRLRTANTADRHDAGDIGEDMALVLDSAEGYFRLGKSRNGHYWARWKWTQGTHTGRYAIGGHTTLRDAILVCLDYVSRVEQGKAIAPLDVGYKGK